MLLAAPSALLALGGLFYGLTRGFTQQCWFWGCHQLEYWDCSPQAGGDRCRPAGLVLGWGLAAEVRSPGDFAACSLCSAVKPGEMI